MQASKIRSKLWYDMTMYRQRSKRSQRIRFFMTYTLVPMLIAGLVVLLTMYMIGYRFNAQSQTITQGGLLQFDSYPSGATVAVDGGTLSSRTATRLDATAGSHTVTMSRDGYVPWQKTVSLEPGTILWLNYARLIPQKLTPEIVYEYPLLASAVANIEESRLALLPDPALPRIDIVQADNSSSPRRTTIELPARSYTEAADGQSHVFRIVSWDRQAGSLLLTHTVGDTTEWLAVDVASPDQAKNLTQIAGQPITEVAFDQTDASRVYVISDQTLRRVDTRQATISAPLAQHVVSMRQSEKGVVTFVSRDDKTARRSIGYYTPGASSSKIIYTTSDMDGALDGQIIEYARTQYSAVVAGSTMIVQKIGLHPSDSDSDVQTVEIARLSLPDGADTVSFSPNGRFATAQKGVSLVAYDLELDQRYAYNVRQQSAGTAPDIRWLDKYHTYTDNDDELRWYEFDGQNSQAIARVASGFDTVLSPDGKYVYAVQSENAAFRLVRFKLGV